MKLNDKILKSVAFVGIKDKGRFRPRATCFFVSVQEDQFRFPHLVTAEHVVSGLLTKGHDIWIRLNLKDGSGAEFFVEDPTVAFKFHPDENERTDVAVCLFNPAALQDADTGKAVDADIVPLILDGMNGFLPTEAFSKDVIGLGAEVVAVGLFRSHYGRERNIPIVRVGNIAALPGEPVYTGYAGYISAYLIEARSIAGLSGSPVFALPDSGAVVARALNGNPGQMAALLGLMHGHFDVANINEDVVASESEPQRSVHTGIGLVIPVEKIVETINHPDLVAMRKEVVENQRKTAGATADSIVEHEPPRSTGENPTHREDFMCLVDAAARHSRKDD